MTVSNITKEANEACKTAQLVHQAATKTTVGAVRAYRRDPNEATIEAVFEAVEDEREAATEYRKAAIHNVLSPLLDALIPKDTDQ